MSFITGVDSEKLCLKLEENLNFGCLNPDNQKLNGFEAMTAIMAGTSNDFEVVSTGRPGVKPGDKACPDKRVTIKYIKPDCEDVATECEELVCGVGEKTKLEYLYSDLNVDCCVYESFSMDLNQYLCSCEDPRAEFLTILRRKVAKMYRDYAKKNIEKLVAALGTKYDGTDGTAIPLNIFKPDATGCIKPQPLGLFCVNDEYNKQHPNCPSDPIILSGSSKFRSYAFMQSLWAGNEDGSDINKSSISLNGAYYDRFVQECLTALGVTADVLTFAPGSLAMADFYSYDSELLSTSTTGRHIFAPVQADGTLLRQKTDIGSSTIGRNFTVDLQVEYIPCDRCVTFKMRKDFALCPIPQDAFCADYNYLLGWQLACEGLGCDFAC